MNNIVKIILGVNIVAGAAGAYFAYSKSGQVGDLKTAKDSALTDAQRANQSARDADKKAKDAAKRDLDVKDGENTRLGQQLKTAKDELAAAKLRPSQADLTKAVQTAKAESKSTISTLEKDLEEATKKARDMETLKAELADANQKLKNLTPKGSTIIPIDDPIVPNIGTGEIAVINNYDQKYGFYTLNRGSNMGIKVGDKFSIFRNERIVGKIVVKRVRPTSTIANFDPALPKPPVPFKVGDKVMKLN